MDKILILAIRGKVDDETEAMSILNAVKVSLLPFAELDLTVNCELKTPIESQV